MSENCPSPVPNSPPELRVRKVTLFSHGIGSYELAAHVTDNASLTLSFRESEMNDVLKSLTVFDRSGMGQIASISYDASSDTIARVLRASTLNIDSERPFSDIIGKATGAAIKVLCAGSDDWHEGVILGVESLPQQRSDDNGEEECLIILAEEKEVQPFPIHSIRRLHFMEERIRKDLALHCEISATALQKERKFVSILAKGSGPRTIYANYAIECPAYKMTYRLLVDSSKKNGSEPLPVTVHAMAIVDNASQQDLEDVEMTIVSGMPLSFTHEIYRARHVPRPNRDMEYDIAQNDNIPGTRKRRGRRRQLAVKSARGGPESGIHHLMSLGGEEPLEFDEAIALSAVPRASSDKVGDLYEYNISGPVSIKSFQTALVPLFSQKCEGSHVSVFAPGQTLNNPSSALWIKNITSATFEKGPISLYDQSRLVGEAMLHSLPPGKEQLLPYSVDLGCRIEKTFSVSSGKLVASSISNGAIQASHYQHLCTKYVVNSSKDEDFDLIVEHTQDSTFDVMTTTATIRKSGAGGAGAATKRVITPWVPPATVVVTNKTRRYRFKVEAGCTYDLEVSATKVVDQHWSLKDCYEDEVITVLLSQRAIDEDAAKKMHEIMTYRSEIVKKKKVVADNERMIADLAHSQDRYRKNLESLNSLGSNNAQANSLLQKYLDNFNSSEERIHTLRRLISEAQEEIWKLEEAEHEKRWALGQRTMQDTTST